MYLAVFVSPFFLSLKLSCVRVQRPNQVAVKCFQTRLQLLPQTGEANVRCPRRRIAGSLHCVRTTFIYYLYVTLRIPTFTSAARRCVRKVLLRKLRERARPYELILVTATAIGFPKRLTLLELPAFFSFLRPLWGKYLIIKKRHHFELSSHVLSLFNANLFSERMKSKTTRWPTPWSRWQSTIPSCALVQNR